MVMALEENSRSLHSLTLHCDLQCIHTSQKKQTRKIVYLVLKSTSRKICARHLNILT